MVLTEVAINDDKTMVILRPRLHEGGMRYYPGLISSRDKIFSVYMRKSYRYGFHETMRFLYVVTY